MKPRALFFQGLRIATMITAGLLASIDGIGPGSAFAAPQDAKASATRRPSILLIMPTRCGMDMGCMETPRCKRPTWTGWRRKAFFSATRLPTHRFAARHAKSSSPANMLISTDSLPMTCGCASRRRRWPRSSRRRATAPASSASGTWTAAFACPRVRSSGTKAQDRFLGRDECNHEHFHPLYFRDDDHPIVDARFEPEVWTDRALEFLDQAGDQPFFLEIAMGPPHDPYGVPEKYMRRYDAARLTMRPNWVEGISGASRKDVAAYYAAITAIDEQVGRLMKRRAERTGAGHDRRVHLRPWQHAGIAGAATQMQALGRVDPRARNHPVSRPGSTGTQVKRDLDSR